MIELFEPYFLSAAVFVGGWILLYIVKKVVVGRLVELSKKTKNDYDDILVNIVATLHPVVLGVGALFFALQFANVPSIVTQSVGAVFMVAVVYQVSIAAAHIVDAVIKTRKGDSGNSAMSFIASMVKVLVWAFGGLVILSNLGVNITSLIAGLGIGGVAIAFALQKILGDLFSSFAIQLDKPFEVGDMIVIGEYRGYVEKIGIKSTRIRSLEGEEIVMSNQDLTSARIKNYRKLRERRITFNFGVLYETPAALIEKIPSMVKDIIDIEEHARLDRVHFNRFGDSALNFQVVYYVTSSEYALYMDTQQSINVALMKKFEKEGIEFAYPTQTLYVKK